MRRIAKHRNTAELPSPVSWSAPAVLRSATALTSSDSSTGGDPSKLKKAKPGHGELPEQALPPFSLHPVDVLELNKFGFRTKTTCNRSPPLSWQLRSGPYSHHFKIWEAWADRKVFTPYHSNSCFTEAFWNYPCTSTAKNLLHAARILVYDMTDGCIGIRLRRSQRPAPKQLVSFQALVVGA